MNENQEVLVRRGEDAVSPQGNNNAVEWKGLPKFVPREKKIALVISCDTTQDRDELLKQLAKIADRHEEWRKGLKNHEVPVHKKTRDTFSLWWPPREQEDLSALRFDFGE